MPSVNGIEVERKFLVAEMPPIEFIQNPSIIHQGYLVIGKDGSEVRLRQREDKSLEYVEQTLTVKSKGGLVRGEREIELEKDQFDELWPMTEGKRLLKTRYTTEHEGDTFEVDSYLGPLAGLLIVEVEFDDENLSEAFTPPEWVGADVTDVGFLKNQALATREDTLHGSYTLTSGASIFIPRIQIVT